jgi:hypothetical protein
MITIDSRRRCALPRLPPGLAEKLLANFGKPESSWTAGCHASCLRQDSRKSQKMIPGVFRALTRGFPNRCINVAVRLNACKICHGFLTSGTISGHVLFAPSLRAPADFQS